MSNTYSHSGDTGDLIAALTVIKGKGGGKLVLFPASCTGYRMTRQRADSLIPLLQCQSYLEDVTWKEQAEGVNLDDWRSHYRNGLNLADMQCTHFGVAHSEREQPWLTVPSANRVAKVIFHRSPRYHNWNVIPLLKRAWQQYHLDAVFVGLPEEHRDFVLHIGPVAYYPTKDYLDLAQVIAGCELYIGNQSSPWWIAEGLKVPTILEVCMYTNNCHFGRWGNLYAVNEHGELPTLEERWTENIIKRADGYTLVSEDRRRVIARSVREVERLPGAMAELGVFRGGTAKIITSVCPHKTLHLYDTFSGLPEGEQGGHSQGEFAASRDEVEKYLAGYNVKLHQGIFPTTAVDDCYSFVHLDADLYSSTKAAIDYFWPRMVKGGYLVFDDWKWTNCPGVERAVTEAFGIEQVEETTAYQCRVKKQ